MILIGRSEKLYKSILMDRSPNESNYWHRTVWVEKEDESLVMWTTIIQNGVVTSHYAHQEKEDAEKMIDEIQEQIRNLEVPYTIYDFTNRNTLEEQIEVLKKNEINFPYVIGCTEDELYLTLSWKI